MTRTLTVVAREKKEIGLGEANMSTLYKSREAIASTVTSADISSERAESVLDMRVNRTINVMADRQGSAMLLVKRAAATNAQGPGHSFEVTVLAQVEGMR